jgi:hypothetical protein
MSTLTTRILSETGYFAMGEDKKSTMQGVEESSSDGLIKGKSYPAIAMPSTENTYCYMS